MGSSWVPCTVRKTKKMDAKPHFHHKTERPKSCRINLHLVKQRAASAVCYYHSLKVSCSTHLRFWGSLGTPLGAVGWSGGNLTASKLLPMGLNPGAEVVVVSLGHGSLPSPRPEALKAFPGSKGVLKEPQNLGGWNRAFLLIRNIILWLMTSSACMGIILRNRILASMFVESSPCCIAKYFGVTCCVVKNPLTFTKEGLWRLQLPELFFLFFPL